ncbi:MAG TPA: hypothetical protein EYH17_04225 [Pyrodictium sp.]|nr:hypothetical protein [Pyrodictium sp.]
MAMMITALYIILITFSTIVSMWGSKDVCQTLYSSILSFANFYSARDILGFVVDSLALIWATMQLEHVVSSIVLLFLPLLNYLVVQSVYMCVLLLETSIKNVDNVYMLWFIGTLQGGEQALVISTLTAVFVLFPRMSREKLVVIENGIKKMPFSTVHIAAIWSINYVAKLLIGLYMYGMKLESIVAWIMGLLWNPYYLLAPLYVLICVFVGLLIASLQCKNIDEKRRIIRYQYMRFKWSGRLD